MRSAPDLKFKVVPVPVPELQFANGRGGFSKDGHSYHILLEDTQWTPSPWINVIANSHEFGCLVSEAGSGYVWSANSRENRLTPWSNDAVSDAPGEAIYIRDEETGQYWNPTPLPARHGGTFLVTHSFGFSRFQNTHFQIEQDLTLFVALDRSIKFSVFEVKEFGLRNSAFIRHELCGVGSGCSARTIRAVRRNFL